MVTIFDIPIKIRVGRGRTWPNSTNIFEKVGIKKETRKTIIKTANTSINDG